MQIKPLSPARFLEEAAPLLKASPGESRRITSRASDALEDPESFRLFAVHSTELESQVAGCMVGAVCFEVSSCYACVVGNISPDAAQELLSELSKEFGSSFEGLRGCDGPLEAVQALAATFSEAFGRETLATDPLELMILDSEPVHTGGATGTLRSIDAKSKLLPILAMWFVQFEKDTDNEAYSLEGQKSVVAYLQGAAGRGDLFVWEVKEKPVAMVMLGRLRPKQVLCVYTVPHQRGRGYGQAAVSAVCTALWHATGGSEPILLSAVHKFGAQRVYERVGFRSTGQLSGVMFGSCHTEAREAMGRTLEGTECSHFDPSLGKSASQLACC